MNLRKHVAGFALFSIIVGSAIFINAYLIAPIARVPPVQIGVQPVGYEPIGISTAQSQPVSYKVSQVLLNFTDDKSYTELQINRLPGQPVPETFWVTTYFFSPAYPGKVWTTKTEIHQQFAQSGQPYFVAASPCSLCSFIKSLPAQRIESKNNGSLSDSLASANRSTNTGFFARVYVSAEFADNLGTPDKYFNSDIKSAIPVVMEWPETSHKLTY
jgi:hypothetical protein